MLNGCAYILTVDVGNTFIRFGLFAEDSAAAQECPLATCEITTPPSITADEARMRLAQVMAALAADAGMPGTLVPTAAVLSCVVPALERPWKAALSRTCTGRVLTVGPGLKTGMPVHYDDPAEIGPDRIADAVAARAVYGSPCIVIDLGTTTNIEVIDTHGTFVGGVIAPGLALGARSLSAAAARLPQVEPSAPTHVIGRNTREAMRSGVVLGEVARIDGMLDMVLAEMRSTKAAGEGSVPIVITGDGELNEGSNWEAAMTAAQFKLSNVVVLVDNNKCMIDGRVDDEMKVEPLDKKFEAFGFKVKRVDGQNMKELNDAIEDAIANHKNGGDQPYCIVMDTFKGAGIDFMEDDYHWHYGALDEAKEKACYESLDKYYKKRCERAEKEG